MKSCFHVCKTFSPFLFGFSFFSTLIYSSHGVICINIKLKTESVLFWFDSWIKINVCEWVHSTRVGFLQNCMNWNAFCQCVSWDHVYRYILCYSLSFIRLLATKRLTLFIHTVWKACSSIYLPMFALYLCSDIGRNCFLDAMCI